MAKGFNARPSASGGNMMSQLAKLLRLRMKSQMRPSPKLQAAAQLQ